MVPSVLKGDVRDIFLDGIATQGSTPDTVDVQAGAEPPHTRKATLDPSFSYSPGRLRPGQEITFSAKSPGLPGLHFEWLFGDGSRASGSQVQHRFADAEGTLLDGSGRFRVLLHLQQDSGEEAWESQALVLSQTEGRRANGPTTRDLRGLPYDSSETYTFSAPADGGYTFTLLTSRAESFSVDDLPPATTPKSRPQVCGSAGNAVQPVQQSLTLTKGRHTLRVVSDSASENAAILPADTQSSPLVLWEGPGVRRRLLMKVETTKSE